MTKIAFGALAVAALAVTCTAMPAFAESVTFKAALSGAEEVPPTASKGTGNVDVTYDSASKKFSWKGTYSGLTGRVTGAHFHGPAEPGKNAGVEIPLTPTASPFEGSLMLSDTQAADLMAGKMYLNLHTAANANGEIRGQIMKIK